MYKVIKNFADLQDNNYVYSVGDTFPREGVEVDAGRILELGSSFNKIGEPLIVEEVEDVEVIKEPKEEKKTKAKSKKKE